MKKAQILESDISGFTFGFISWARLIASCKTRFPPYKNGGNNTSSRGLVEKIK